METAHPTTALDVDLDDVRSALQLAGRTGNVLTAVIETEPQHAQAADRSAAGWASQRDQAEADGVPAQVLDAIDPLVPDAHLDGPRLYVVAAEDGVRWREPLSDGVASVEWSPLPSLMPLIEDRQRRVPMLLARCDRRGADLSLRLPLGSRDLGEVEQADGPEHKVPGGGWSHRRYQQRVENTMEGTADDIAAAVAAGADQLGPGTVVVLTGDHRTVDHVADRLGDRYVVRTVPGGRGEDGSEHAIEDAIDALREQVVGERDDAAVSELREWVQRSRAVEGAEGVLEALAEGRAQRLVVAPSDDSGRSAQLDPSTGLPVLDDGAAMDAPPVAASVRDVAVHAALATSASIRVVTTEQAPDGGVGALLRWDEPERGG